MKHEIAAKLAQVRKLLQTHGATAALIGRQSNFSWLSCGGEAHIPLNTDRSFGQLLVTPGEFYILANRIEMPRLETEALRGLNAIPLCYDWHEKNGAAPVLKTVADPKTILSDTGDWGTRSKPELFPPLRYSLQPEEIKRYRSLGRAAEEALRETCLQIEPGQTEFEMAAALAQSSWTRQLTPVVLLVATDERIRRYRHPLPTNKKLKRHAMLVLCARRHGLIVALTRLVHFGKIAPDLRKRHDAVCAIDAAFQQNTRPNALVRDVFALGLEAYAEKGFPDEWRLHHQGGPCGYEGRDYLGSLHAPGNVQVNQPFAWNPSITGTKSEDTILAGEKGIELITPARDWPMVEVGWKGKTVERPDILVR
jgi:Xaa-Pro aminopeptidase